jgi:hypothetical protein
MVAAAVAACGSSTPEPAPGPTTPASATAGPATAGPATPGALQTVQPAPSPSCETAWGTEPEEATGTKSAPLTDVRAAQHECYDRGDIVPLRGDARLQIVAKAPAYDDNFQSTFVPADPAELVDVTGWRTFRQVAFAGSFEGQSTLGLGVRVKLPFRVLVVDGGRRIVVDVAHSR